MSALSPMPQDRPDSIEAFCDRLLAGLGSVREGRRSLEQMVGELSNDECAADDIEPSSYEDDTVEVDPALGWAGTALGPRTQLHHARHLGALMRSLQLFA